MKPLLLLVIAVALSSPLSAQDSTTTTIDSAAIPLTKLYRSPRVALVLGSLIPGAGHIYSGEYLRGFGNYESTVMMIGGGVLVFLVNNCLGQIFTSCDPGPEWPHQALGVVAVGAGVWHWVSTARDAPHAAQRANERHERKMRKARPIVEAPLGSRGEWRAGVAIPW